MFILILHRFLLFAGLIPFRIATASSLNIGSLPQAAVAETPSLELNANLTLPPSPPATTLRNTSNDPFPPYHIIIDTNPHVFLKINPTRHDPLDQSVVTYLIMRGLESLVQYPVASPLPAQGMLFRWQNVAITVKSHIPGTLDLTYRLTATLLRGLWEVLVLCRFSELDTEVYVGRQDEAHHRGHVALYLSAPSKETA